MKKKTLITSRKMRFCLIFFLFLAINHFFIATESSHVETYIVHVEPPNGRREMADLETYYLSFLPDTLSARASPSDDDDEEVAHIVFSYEHVFIGFAARLSEEDVNQMERKLGFISAEKEEIFQLDTTYTPNFLGLNRNTGFWQQSNHGRGIVIGVVDSGINPDHPSFGDTGIPTPPARWRGQCQFTSRRCNNKLIGARRHVGGPEPFDDSGHGTHVAGIAAGNYVNGANVNGNAAGTASGIAPLAHLAVYKVCFQNADGTGGCPESAILAGIDAAISDGVDILSISIGSVISRPFYSNNVLIGAFRAIERRIFVSCSAGNDGPSSATLSNEAPWVLTVGASTTDRQIRSTLVLGNNRTIEGQTASNFPSLTRLTLIYPGLTSTDVNVSFCASSQFPVNIRGRIVICSTGGFLTNLQKGNNVRSAGGSGMILINHEQLGFSTSPDFHVLPALHVSYTDGLQIISYLRSTTSPTATLSFQGTVFGDRQAPAVAQFSSRGPNRASNGILKPDILGPGVDILSASHSNRGFVFNSGTSMACPHLSGVAALLKSTHPDWSPAAIKSAIMTTADIVNRGNNPIVDHFHQPATLLARGAGQVNPTRSNNPGLIYDLTSQDYIPYLCGLGYNAREIQIIVGRVVDCSSDFIAQESLNLPSFSVVLRPNLREQIYFRTVTNVGAASSNYNVRIEQPQGLQISVFPATLRFGRLNQRLAYQVTFRLISNKGFTNESALVGEGSLKLNNFRLYQGSIIWTSGSISVRIPVVGLLFQNGAPLMGAQDLLASI